MPNPIPSVIKRTARHFFAVAMIATAFPAHAVTVESLVSFNALNPIKGLNPKGSLIVDANNDLLGITELGGTAGSTTGTSNGYGTIFRLSGANPSSLTTVHEFSGGTDGFKPQGPLLKTKIGGDSFYFGTTAGGQSNLGSIFRMAADGAVVTLKEFASNTAPEIGSAPSPSLVEGNDGLLYGTTTAGGLNGGGTLFRIAKTGEFAVLRQFSNEVVDCVRPSALVKDQDATLTNLYGVTAQGGTFGRGTVFKYTTQGAGTFKVLVNFGALLPAPNGIQPQAPKAALALASSTTLVGTTTLGGTANFGTVFRVSTSGAGLTFLSLTGNTGSIKGSSPEAPLFLATDGNFYGTTRLGGKDGFGTVFKINSAFTALTTLVEFEGAGGASNKGAFPIGGLLQDNERNLYGTTSGGGDNAQGMVYRLFNALPLKALATTTGQLNNSTTGTRSTITGLVSSPDSDAKVFFEYGTDTTYGKTVASSPATVTRNVVDAACKAALSGLLPDTDYHYRIVAQNAGGTTWGEDVTFHTS
ncbi:MAG: hypothetical protein JWO89_1516, partial [Verrucomicrobiaceae bacterium]|nr:hypothetical protein [Verrucomicrobiaceae bacterium]